MGKHLYFLVYERGRLELRFPGLEARPAIIMRGVQADKAFRAVKSVLDGYALKYDVDQVGGKTVVGLSADVGLAVTMFMLFAYGADPERCVGFLEKLLAGQIPLSGYFSKFFDMAADLSDLDGGRKEATISEGAAKVVSKMMRTLYGRFAGCDGAKERAETAVRAGPLDAFL